MEEGAIAKWHKKEGEFVEEGELILEVSTDKATVEYNALDKGWLKKILVPEGKTVKVNQPIAIFTEKKEDSIEGYKTEGEEPKAVKSETPVAPKAFTPEKPLESTPVGRERVAASPLARKLAQEKGVDIRTIKGSGPGGRVISKDLSMQNSQKNAPTIAPGTYEEEELSQMRKAIAVRLQEAKASIPHYYVTMEVDAEPLSQIYEQLKTGGLKVTINDFMIRATALALRQHPNVNSGFNAAKMTLIRFKTIDISIAVSIPEGLITPIIRHADFKSLAEIGAEMRLLGQRAKEGKLKPEEYKGGSFTISNLGMFGVKDFQPIINPPQAAILAVSSILPVPVVKECGVVPGKVMSLSLASDHRVVDGVAAAQFLKTLKGILEEPALLMV